jgi:hypothetical protein
MAWFTGFHNALEFGFHNSQRVGKGIASIGCVRVTPCACAKEIHDNTSSGTTTVCVHNGKPCHPLPAFGDPDTTHTSRCAKLFEALPPKPAAKGTGKGTTGGGDKKPAEKKKGGEQQQGAPPGAPEKAAPPAIEPAPAAKDTPVAADDVSPREDPDVVTADVNEDEEEEETA